MGALPIQVRRVRRSRAAEVDPRNLPFGSVFSDHMLVARWRGGWEAPTIVPYGPLRLAPSISALHYGLSVFEGLKAHRSAAGDVLLFRAADNARRLNRSAARLSMPDVPEDLFLGGLRELVRLDRAWVPGGEGALYIRPCLFSVQESLRVVPAEEYLFVIFTCPVGPYFSEGVEALVTDRYVRAFPGGTGDTKPAGNYAPALLADREARAQGLHTVLWLDARERRYVEECGVMNVFFVIDGTVVTPELTGTILPGITRDSVITLLRDAGASVVERRIAIEEVLETHARGALRECFGTGTAATVLPVRRLRYREQDVVLPPVEASALGAGVRQRLLAVMRGEGPDPHGWTELI